MNPPSKNKKRGSSRMQRVAEYELKRRKMRSSKNEKREEKISLENPENNPFDKKKRKRKPRGASRHHQPDKEKLTKLKKPPSNVRPVKPPENPRKRRVRQKSQIVKRKYESNLRDNQENQKNFNKGNSVKDIHPGSTSGKSIYDMKDEVKTAINKYLDLNEKLKKLTAQHNLTKNELECYKSVYGDSIHSESEQSFENTNNHFSKKISFKKIWKRIDKSQKSLILRLKRENYVLRRATEQNEQTQNLINSLKFNSQDYKASITRILETVEIKNPEEGYSILKSLNQALSLVGKINSDLQYAAEELELVRQEQATKNGNNWSFQQQGFYEVSFNADVNEIIKVMFDYEGRILEKIERISEEAQNENSTGLKILKENLLDEVINVNKKYNLLVEYKKYDKKFLGKFRKKFSQAEKERKNFNAILRSTLKNLEKTLDHNLKELVQNNSKNTLKNEIDVTFLSKFFENRFKVDEIDIDKELSLLVLKIGYFEYITATKKYKSKFKSMNSILKNFVKEFEQNVSDPIFEILNFVDNVNLSYGENEAYKVLKEKVIDQLDSFLREDFRDNEYSTIVSLKALKVLSNLAKQYYESIEDLEKEEKEEKEE